jgi:uncharacterized protein (TIGR03437 family)
MSKRKLAVVVLCLAAAVAMLSAQDVFVAAGSGSTDTQVSGFTTHPVTPSGGFQAGPGTFQIVSTPDGSKFYSIASSATQPVAVTNSTFATTQFLASFTQAPTGAVMTPDGTRLAVAAGTLHIFDTATDTELVSGGISAASGATIIDLGVSLDGKAFFTLATLAGSGSQLNSISTATNQITGTLAVPGTATGVTVGPNNLLYVSTQNLILEVNPTTLTTTANGAISLNAQPTKPVITPDGKYLLAGNLTPVTGSSVLEISIASHAIASTFPNVGFSFGNFLIIGANEILSVATENQGFYEINPNNGGPMTINPFTISGVSTAFQGTAVSDEVGTGPRTTAETFYAASGGILYAYDIPSKTITAQETLTDPKLGGAVSFAGAASTGTQPSTLLTYGANQTVAPGTTSLPIVVQALDQTGRPVYGATVTFTPNSSSVSVSPASVVTGGNGYAVAYLTASSAVGTVTVTAAAGAVQAAIAENVGGTTGGGGGSTSGDILTIIAGQGQILDTDSSTTLAPATPLAVQVTDSSGNAVPGVPVTFALSQGEGVVIIDNAYAATTKAGSVPGSLIVTTDSNGEAAVGFATNTLGLEVQVSQSQVVATGPNAATATFFETAVPVLQAPTGYVVKPAEGTSLTGEAGTTLTAAVQAEVVTLQGAFVPNIAISLSNGGLDPTKFPSATCNTPSGLVITPTNGAAICNVVLGGILGTGSFHVNFGNFLNSSSFQITVTPGAPAVVNILNGNNQSGVPGQLLPVALLVQVTDSSGNPLGGTPVNWQVLTAGAVTLSNVSSSTSQNGEASALATLGKIAGPAQVQVTAGSASAVFTLTTNIPEAGVQKLSGDGQSATVSTAFAAPLVVEAVDSNGNPVPGAQVNFAVTGGSATLGSASAVTGANGQASTTVTAGATAGSITITATSGSFTATFTLTAVAAVQPPPPGPTNITFVNGASFQPGIAPGGIALVSGNGIAPNVDGIVTAFSIVGPLPTTLAGVSITFNGTPAPIYYISNTGMQQTVAIQVPFEVQPGTATVEVSVSPCQSGTANCEAVVASTTVNTQVQQVAPGVFFSGTQNLAVVVRSDGSYVSATNPAQRGEVIQLYVTGLGSVSPAALTGAAGLSGEAVTAQLLVGLNNAGVPFQSADYAPGMVGVYVITFQVPPNTAAGPSQPVGLEIYDSAGNVYYAQSTYIPIQ